MKIVKYSEIEIGQSAELIRIIAEEDIQKFGELSGDFNPVHFDEEWAKQTIFKSRIAHGLLSATFISTAIGMHLPGPGTIYLGQNLSFRRPVRIGDTITTRVEVIKKDDEKQRITLKTTCTNQEGELVIDGEALVMLMKMDE
ncbi:MAG: MaoC family dehydratase [Candidatus Hermodarchaeota archaeon]